MAKKTTASNVTELHPKPREKSHVNLLSDVPAIRKYLERIGAEAKSPRTATITTRVEGGYDLDDIASIKLELDGTWHVKPPSLAPTDEEQEEIAKQASDYSWPHLLKMEHPVFPKEVQTARKANPMNVFDFWDTAGKLIMVQVRVDLKGGKKRYVPWTYWDDKKWRACEPDEPLPLWGLDQLKHHSVVFLHEGAKSARHARKIASLEAGKGELALDSLPAKERARLLNHPWAEYLANAAHLGWIGGAPNPHRTDWSPLKNGIHRVFVVADNERQGVDAIPKISQHLSQWNIQVYCLRFDSRFPPSFDLADNFFEPHGKGKLWEWRGSIPKKDEDDEQKRYIGPPFRSLLGPATWAVKEIVPKEPKEPKGRGRPKAPIFVLRDVFRDQWVVAKEMDPPLYINRWDPSLSYKAETFNLKNRPFSGGAKSLADMMGRELPVDIDSVSYEPGRKNRLDLTDAELIVRGKRTFNTWTPTLIQPVTRQHYDPSQWIGFLEHLFPIEEERQMVMRWCATLIDRPEIRMTFGLLLVSIHHGVGKTTLGHILSVLVGEHNTSWPSESQIVDNDFNSWQVRKRLVICNEIYSGHSWKAYNKLKTVISDTEVDVNEKHVKGYTISNYCHVLAFSNSRQALKIEEHDRRIYMPKVTETLKPEQFWKEFRGRWLPGDGYGIIRQWASEYLTHEEPIGPEMHAPMTEAKRRAMDDAMDEDKLLAMELGSQAIAMASERNPFLVLTDRQVQAWVATKLGLKHDSEDPKARYAFRRSLTNVCDGLEAAGMRLVREWKDRFGFRHRAFSTFDPTSDEGRKAMERWSELVSTPVDVERWTASKQTI